MTFANAIASIKDGQATKPPSWRGYVRRRNVQVSGESEFSGTAAYSVGAKATYNGYRYVCVVAVPAPGAGADPNQFDFSKWKAIDFDHVLEFVDGDDQMSGPDPQPSGKYYGTVSDDGSVTYSTPAGYSAVSSLDAQLLSGMLADDWQLYDASSIESARTGTGGRW